jgi:lipopolysaccharide transport system ATP-binding protein
MSDTVISIENVSKSYQLGVIGTGTFRGDVQRWWAKLRGLPDPHLKIGETDYGNRDGETLWALKDVNFQVQQGEALGIIGRNGAGKSTLLKILSRVTAPTTGEVKVKGRIASLLEVGTGFHPELTGRENIYLNGAILGMKKFEIASKFDEIVDFSGVEQFIDTPVKRYSSGMYVRLAFAVAAHLDPEILVVDEVLAVGDAVFQKKCLGKMGEASKLGRTILFVSHNLAAISNLCTSAILLDKGKIISNGNTQDVISLYLQNQYIEQSGDIDLTDTKKASRRNSLDNSIFKWTRAQVINSKGEHTTTIGLMEPFELILTGNLDQPVDDLIVGFGVMSKLGFSLFNSHSVDAKIKQSFDKGQIVYKVKFEQNYLGPGPYVIDLASNGSGIVDWIPEAINISVEEITPQGNTMVRSNYTGVIVHPCCWEVAD